MSAIITIHHSCGHEGKHAVSGNDTERRQREDWLRRQPCQACWRAAQQRDATAQGSALGLPPLEGNPDEIAWAEILRAKSIAHNKAYHDQLLAENPFEDDPVLHTAVVEAAENALAQLKAECHANWWIENRFETLNYVKQSAVAALAGLAHKKESESGI